jgi:hypothetical protein
MEIVVVLVVVAAQIVVLEPIVVVQETFRTLLHHRVTMVDLVLIEVAYVVTLTLVEVVVLVQ